MLISPFDHNTIYFGANYLFKSTSRGDAWTMLGPDLTRQLSDNFLPTDNIVLEQNVLVINIGGIKIRRDAQGRVLGVMPPQETDKEAISEAVIHMEIDRQTDQQAPGPQDADPGAGSTIRRPQTPGE